MKPLRIFISSPGDVAQERKDAKLVIEQLRRRYAPKFILMPVVWEDLPLEPDMSFQQGIDVFLEKPGVDIGVFILWSRLGSPLGTAIPKPDGTQYRSGTEREYDLMIRARRQSEVTEGRSRPRMIVYTRKDDSSFAAKLRGKTTSQQKDLIHQKELAESFMLETFRDYETGENIGAYHSFERPTTFSEHLRTHLQAFLDEMAGNVEEVIWDVESQGPPFLGLDAFQPEHADVFFGREQEILRARSALRDNAANGCAFLLLFGASGSGKSSLARAGILPEILAHEPDEQTEHWKSLIVTPAELGLEPIFALLHQLADPSLLPELKNQVPSLEDHAVDLAGNADQFFQYSFPKAIEAAATRLGGNVRFVLVIDQLEELFTKEALRKESRRSFLTLIEILARSGSFWIIATARSDFYQEIQDEPALASMKEGNGILDVLPPKPDAIARLITEPARLAGINFEEKEGQRLSSRILSDAANHAELLPLLEFVLLELFENAKGNLLTHATYDKLGGVEGALRRKAESTYKDLPSDAAETLGQVLQALVTLGDDSDTEGEIDKPVKLRASLEAFPKKSPSRILINSFIAARLFTIAKVDSSAEATFTVAHESLLRVWPRAVAWKNQNSDFLRTRSRIAARMKEGSPLLKGDPLLETAAVFLATNSGGFAPTQREWIRLGIDKVRSKERQDARRRRLAFAALSALTIFAVVGGLFAMSESANAKMQAKRAVQETALKEGAQLKIWSNIQELETEISENQLSKSYYFKRILPHIKKKTLSDTLELSKQSELGSETHRYAFKLSNDLSEMMISRGFSTAANELINNNLAYYKSCAPEEQIETRSQYVRSLYLNSLILLSQPQDDSPRSLKWLLQEQRSQGELLPFEDGTAYYIRTLFSIASFDNIQDTKKDLILAEARKLLFENEEQAESYEYKKIALQLKLDEFRRASIDEDIYKFIHHSEELLDSFNSLLLSMKETNQLELSDIISEMRITLRTMLSDYNRIYAESPELISLPQWLALSETRLKTLVTSNAKLEASPYSRQINSLLNLRNANFTDPPETSLLSSLHDETSDNDVDNHSVFSLSKKLEMSMSYDTNLLDISTRSKYLFMDRKLVKEIIELNHPPNARVNQVLSIHNSRRGKFILDAIDEIEGFNDMEDLSHSSLWFIIHDHLSEGGANNIQYSEILEALIHLESLYHSRLSQSAISIRFLLLENQIESGNTQYIEKEIASLIDCFSDLLGTTWWNFADSNMTDTFNQGFEIIWKNLPENEFPYLAEAKKKVLHLQSQIPELIKISEETFDVKTPVWLYNLASINFDQDSIKYLIYEEILNDIKERDYDLNLWTSDFILRISLAYQIFFEKLLLEGSQDSPIFKQIDACIDLFQIEKLPKNKTPAISRNIVIVNKVFPETQASISGIQEGDKIKSYDGIPIMTDAQFARLVKRERAEKDSKEVVLICSRDSKDIEFILKPGKIGVHTSEVAMKR